MESKVKALINDWDYDKAVAIARPMAESWAKKTVEMAKLLYIAKSNLENQGYRTDLKSNENNSATSPNLRRSSNGTIGIENKTAHSWKQFCRDIGLPLATADSWVNCYDPDKEYLLTNQEYKEAKKLELDTFYEDVTEMRETDPGYVPKDIDLKWSRKYKWSETQYQKWLTERNFSINDKAVEPAVISRDAKIQEFGLWNTEFILDLQQRCQEITHEKAEVFAKYVAAYRDIIPAGITSRDFMRIPVIVEAILSPLSPEGKKKCLSSLVEFLSVDGLNSEGYGNG